MAKQKQSKEEHLTELSGWTKTEKANKVLDELKAKSRKVNKVWISSQEYFPEHPRIYIEIPKGLGKKEVIERIQKLLVR
jgi:hypothetical protein